MYYFLKSIRLLYPFSTSVWIGHRRSFYGAGWLLRLSDLKDRTTLSSLVRSVSSNSRRIGTDLMTKVWWRYGFGFISLSTKLESENGHLGYNGWHSTNVFPVVFWVKSQVIMSAAVTSSNFEGCFDQENDFVWRRILWEIVRSSLPAPSGVGGVESLAPSGGGRQRQAAERLKMREVWFSDRWIRWREKVTWRKKFFFGERSLMD